MRALLWTLLAAAVALVFIPGPAEAKVDGPCTATIGGTDMAMADKVVVQSGDNVPYEFSSPETLSSYELQLFYGPYAATPSSGDVDSGETMVKGEAEMADYAWLGVGLYELTGTVTLADGRTCTGSILVEVEGNPLTTAVGATAAAVSGLSTIALIGLFLKDAGVFFAGA